MANGQTGRKNAYAPCSTGGLQALQQRDRSLPAQLLRQQTERNHSSLGLFIPRYAAIESDTVVELLCVTEYQSWCNADALLQRAHMQLLGIDPTGQAHPEDEAACRPGHLGTLGEVLLHCQLIGTEVLAIFLAYVVQMPVVAAIFQLGGQARRLDLGPDAS